MQNQIKKTQSGYSLIELSISLAIIGVVIAGSIIGVTSILRSNNVNKTISQTNTATNKIVARLTRDVNYANANTQNLAQVGQEVWEESQIDRTVPATLVVRHFFANQLFVRPLLALDVTSGTQANQGYIYTLTGVPELACSELAVGIETLATSMNIANEAPLAAGNQALVGTVVKTPELPFNSATAAAACRGASNSSTITFLVPRR